MRMHGLLAGALLAVAASARPAWAECPSFADAVALAGHQYQDLIATRDASSPYDAPTYEGAYGAIEAYLAMPSSPRETGDRGLIFYLRDGEQLCGFFWSTRDAYLNSIEFAIPMPSSDLAALIDKAVASVSESAAPLERRAVLRSAADARLQSRAAVPLSRPPSPRSDAARLLKEVATQLFPPEIREDVKELSSLTIVPAANIGIVPFAALDPDGDGLPLVETTALNVEGSLGDVLSARIFALAGGVVPQAIAGDPDASDDPEWVFPRLPGAAREARAVAERFGTVAVIGPDATVAEVLPRLRNAEYVHIAAHGFSSVADPIDGSFIALTGGRLTAREIQSLRLERPALVTLSACQTGLGGQLDVGIIGLSRGFLLAGAAGVVASLWNVDDEATAQIMISYVRNLAEHAPAEALRMAQSEAREKWPDPAKWAAFLMFGSRIVSLQAKPEPQDPVATAAFSIVRNGAAVEIDPRTATQAVAGDELTGHFVNVTSERLEVLLVYRDATGAMTQILHERLGPGGTLEGPFLSFSDGVVGREQLFIIFETVEPMSAMANIGGITSLAPLPAVLRLLGPSALPAFLPERGIVNLTDVRPGPQLSVAQPSGENTVRRRTVQVLEFEVTK